MSHPVLAALTGSGFPGSWAKWEILPTACHLQPFRWDPSPGCLEHQDDPLTDGDEAFTCQNCEQFSASDGRDLCMGMHEAPLGLYTVLLAPCSYVLVTALSAMHLTSLATGRQMKVLQCPTGPFLSRPGTRVLEFATREIGSKPL